ncbi:MAG: ankyrin repeat domain-containing protein, partial [Brevinematales bacterium]|nr:ankyrin repeat domain-containing protein [Brevinematales bacterium]
MVDITEVNDNGSFFELVSACEQGNLNEVQRLVEQQRWDPYEYEEAFIGAVANGSLDVVRYLCEKCGCDPFDSEGYALRLAFVKGDLEIVKYFLAKNMVRDQKLIVDIVTYLVK